MELLITNNNSLSFDGVDDYIDFGNSSDFDFSNSALTVMCWVNLSSVNSIDGIISKNETFNHGWWLSTISGSPSWSNPNTFSFGGSPSNSNYFGTYSPLIFNNWVNISATHINGEQKLYVNGQLTNQGSHQYNLYNSATSLLVGKKTGDTYFNGLIDDVHIWSSALTQSEIQSYMSSPPTGNEAGLVGYWNFNEGSGNTVTDLSGNGNNGTINGATWSTDAPAQYANNCTATDDVEVTVNPQPIVDAGIDQTICEGSSA